jgi:hypothetical protein
MIRIGPFKDLDIDAVVGKIVFKAEVRNWPGDSEPYFVTDKSHSRLYISRLVQGAKATGKPPCEGIPEDCIGVAWGYMALSTVACVCDTVEEANTVIRKLAEVRALDGLSVGSEDRHVPQAELPKMSRTVDPSGSVNLSGSPWARHAQVPDEFGTVVSM